MVDGSAATLYPKHCNIQIFAWLVCAWLAREPDPTATIPVPEGDTAPPGTCMGQQEETGGR